MFIGDLIPTVFAAWKPGRAMPSPGAMPLAGLRFARPSHAAVPRTMPTSATVLPRGLCAVAPETQAVLAAAKDLGRRRYVELQMAVEPDLVAEVDAAAYRTWLRHVLLAAIGRAYGAVLVTAMRQADGVEVVVLDDGTGAPHDGPTQAAEKAVVPPGATISVDYHPEHGTTVLLRLRPPDRLAFPAAAYVGDGFAAPNEY
jgi:hypothetical protein